MQFLMINGHDYSQYVNELSVDTHHVYKGGTRSNGREWATLQYTRSMLTVGIVPLDDDVMKRLQEDLSKFSITVSFRDPKTNALKNNVKCIVPTYHAEYYNLAGKGRMYKGFKFIIKEL